MDFQGDKVLKNLLANVGDSRDASLLPGLGRSSGERNGNPLQDSYVEKSMDRGAWWATVHGVTKESDVTEPIPPSIRVFSNESTLRRRWP